MRKINKFSYKKSANYRRKIFGLECYLNKECIALILTSHLNPYKWKFSFLNYRKFFDKRYQAKIFFENVINLILDVFPNYNFTDVNIDNDYLSDILNSFSNNEIYNFDQTTRINRQIICSS